MSTDLRMHEGLATVVYLFEASAFRLASGKTEALAWLGIDPRNAT